MALETSGKPNHLYAFSGIENDACTANQLSNMSPEEFVATAEKLAGDPAANANLKRIFDQLVRERADTEHNRIKVQGALTKKEEKAAAAATENFKMNWGHELRVIESLDSKSHQRKSSYLNMKIRKNIHRASEANKSIAERQATNTILLEARGVS